MIKSSVYLVVVASLAASVGCNQDETKAKRDPFRTVVIGDAVAPVDPARLKSHKAQATKTVELFTKMAATVKAGAGDCEKIGLGLDALVAEKAALRKVGERFYEDPEAKQWIDDNYGGKLQSIMGTLVSDISPCMGNPAVVKALADFGQNL